MFDEAVQFTKASVAANEFDPRLRLVYAEALRRAGDTSKALNQYEIAVKLDPRLWRAQDCLAHGYLWAFGSTAKISYRTAALRIFRQLAAAPSLVDMVPDPVSCNVTLTHESGRQNWKNFIDRMEKIEGTWQMGDRTFTILAKPDGAYSILVPSKFRTVYTATVTGDNESGYTGSGTAAVGDCLIREAVVAKVEADATVLTIEGVMTELQGINVDFSQPWNDAAARRTLRECTATLGGSVGKRTSTLPLVRTAGLADKAAWGALFARTSEPSK